MGIDSIHFRRITMADEADFFELRRCAILAGCTGYYPADLLHAWTDPLTDGRLRDPPAEHCYFAALGDQIVGSGMIDLDTARMDAVFVHPMFFRRGIGAAIVRHLENIARAHGLQRLTLDATLNAVEFYRSVGFVGDDTRIYSSPRGLSLSCAPMTKRLM
jgi:GNAT superfamily N-acetyltransferase